MGHVIRGDQRRASVEILSKPETRWKMGYPDLDDRKMLRIIYES
jgi:hypothetical protein